MGGCCICFVKSYRIGGRYNAEGLHALKSFLLLLLPSAGGVRSCSVALVLVRNARRWFADLLRISGGSLQ